VQRIDDPSITAPTIDNTKFTYFVELVVCDSTIEPLSTQNTYNTP
jgi:hypothetical protein